MDFTYSPRPDTPGFEPDLHAPAATPASRLLDRIAATEFPCVGAKAALARDAIRTVSPGTLGCPRGDGALLDAIEDFAAYIEAQPADSNTVHSLAAVFDGPGDTDEQRFEALLWAQLQRLHALDRARGHGWADGVSPDPDDARFSLSLAGHPFFVIGLHAGASRLARRFESPVLVFNSHVQFDALRADGRYAKMQAATRARDTALQGGINPNLADFGTAPETRQYSGRAVEADWRCPLHIRTGRTH